MHSEVPNPTTNITYTPVGIDLLQKVPEDKTVEDLIYKRREVRQMD